MGSTPDILPYAMFDWYQVVYYWTPVEQFPHERKLIFRWIGVSENCVDEMAYVILTKKGKVVIRKSVWGLSDDDLSNPEIKAKIAELDKAIIESINAYLNAPTKERCYTIAGPKFGPDNEGRPVLIVRALYGLRSSGTRWRDYMASTLRSSGFKGCLADPDIWMRPANKPDGTPYYEYVLIDVDGILAISHDPKSIMDSLAKHYTLKAGSVKSPDEYLVTQIRTHTIDTGLDPCTCWAMSCDNI
jgi:hypothetical protein